MHIVNITIQGGATPASLFYDTAREAMQAVESLCGAIDQHAGVYVTDSKGHTLAVIPRNVCFVVVVDMDKDIKNQMTLLMAQEKAQRAHQANLAAQGGLLMPATAGLGNGRFNA